MTLLELSDIVQSNIIVTRYHGQGDRWSAQIEHAEIREGEVMLAGTYGDGKTAEQALHDYVEKVKGKLMILHAMNPEKRREYGVPKTLCVEARVCR